MEGRSHFFIGWLISYYGIPAGCCIENGLCLLFGALVLWSEECW
jgi:hypothetical protein